MQVGRLNIPDENAARGIAALPQMRKMFAARFSVGERFDVPRPDGKDSLPVLIYRPRFRSRDSLPIFFNMHGGVWLAGDAMVMESFCQLMALQWRLIGIMRTKL